MTHYAHIKPTEMKFKDWSERLVCLVQKHHGCEINLSMAPDECSDGEKQHISLLND